MEYIKEKVRPIDANALEERSHPCVRGTYGYSAKAEDWMVSVGDIRNEPTLDYEPVRYGHWIIRHDGPYGRTRVYCSFCKNHSGIGGILKNQLKPYCPNCGAKMIKEDEDTNEN